MTTPMFKVLAQSLRLGQPPDAVSAVRVLVEAFEKQAAEIEDLRAKLAIVSSRLHYTEARVGRILEASEPDLAESPPSSLHTGERLHALVSGPGQQSEQPARGSQRPPPMSGPVPGSAPVAQAVTPQSAPPGASGGRAPSVRPQSIPHALPIPQAPALPQGLTNPHPPLNIPQPMPLPPPGGGPSAPHAPSLAQQSALLQQMAQPPLVPQNRLGPPAERGTSLDDGPTGTGPKEGRSADRGWNAPAGGVPVIPRAPAIPAAPKPPKLADLVEDGGFDEFNQTLVINKRDVAQLAREAPFPIHPAGHAHPGPAAERSRANTSATPFLQPGLQPPPAPAMQAPAPPAAPQPQPPANPQPHAAARRHTGSQPAIPVMHEREPAQDGTKTGIHAHRPAPEPQAGPTSGVPSSGGLAPRPGIDPPLAALASANITDEDDAGSDADFTLTDQTARVDLSGLSELEREAGIAPFPAGRAPRGGD